MSMSNTRNKFIFLIINLIGGILIQFDNPIIGSIILIFSGFITFIFPKICYCPMVYSRNVPINKEIITYIKFGSLSIILFGVGIFAYLIEIVPPIIFDYASKSFWQILLAIVYLTGFTVLASPSDCEQLKYELKHFKYDKYEDEFIRNNMELFIYALIVISIGGYILLSLIMIIYDELISLPYYLLFFAGFLIIIYPNAILTKRTKSDYLFARLCGILFMTGGVIRYTLILDNALTENVLIYGFILIYSIFVYNDFSMMGNILLSFSSILMIIFGFLILTITEFKLDFKKILSSLKKTLKKHGFI